MKNIYIHVVLKIHICFFSTNRIARSLRPVRQRWRRFDYVIGTADRHAQFAASGDGRGNQGDDSKRRHRR